MSANTTSTTKIDELTPETARKLIKEMVQEHIELEFLTQEKTLPELTRFMVNAHLKEESGSVNPGHFRIYEGYDPVVALYAFKDSNGYAKKLQKRLSANLSAPELLSFIPVKKYEMVESMNLKKGMEFFVEFAFEELLGKFPSLTIYSGKSGSEAVSALKESIISESIERYKRDCETYCSKNDLKMNSNQLTRILYLLVQMH